eukprot:Gb_26333 [translate_table: standard]
MQQAGLLKLMHCIHKPRYVTKVKKTQKTLL